MMLKVCLLCIAVGVLQALPSRSETTTGMCTSHFDFLEKWVEKIIRFEIKLDSMEEKFEEKLKILTRTNYSKMEPFTETVDSHSETLKSHSETLKLHSEMLTSMSEALTSRSDVNEAFITKYETKLSGMETAMMTYIEASNQTLSGLQATVKSEVQAMVDQANQKLRDMKGEFAKKDVVFQVKGRVDQPTPNAVVKFQTSMTNIDNVYDLKSGYFRAPQPGTYWFAVQMCAVTNREFSPSIYVNDELVNRGFLRDRNNVDCETVTAVAILQTGDTVCVKSGQYLSTAPLFDAENYHFTTFMGARVN